MTSDLLADARVLAATPALRTTTLPGAIYVGLKPHDAGPGLHKVGESSSLVLIHKFNGTTYQSVTAFVVEAVDVAACKAQLGVGRDPARPFAGCTLIVEDASPDTCLSIVALAYAAQGRLLSQDWVRAADAWESGLAHLVSPETADWAQLASALGHGVTGLAPEEDRIAALRRVCTLTEGLAALGKGPVAPADVADVTLAGLVDTARALIAMDVQKCRHIGDIAEVVQLSIPLKGLAQRRLVDGVLLVEREISGVLKALLRQDKSAPDGDGYAFLAVHRPELTGTGNDITFSVDPRSRLTLEELWRDLDLREWASWERKGLARPVSPPRPMDHVAALGVPASVSPWWITHDGTLVAAPHSIIVANKTVDPMVGWNDALDVLWRRYAPLQEFDFRVADGRKVDFFDGAFGPARERIADAPALYLCEMHAGAAGASARWSPTLTRACAAFVMEGRTHLLRLPRSEDVIEEKGRGGVVVITELGAAIIQLYNAADFPRQEIHAAVRAAAIRLETAQTLERRVQELRVRSGQTIMSRRMRQKGAMLADIHAVLSEAMECRTQKQARSSDPYVARIQASLEKFWAADERFGNVVREAISLRDTIVSASDVRTNDLVHAVAIYGFAFALLVNVAFSSAMSDVIGALGRIVGTRLFDNELVKAAALVTLWLAFSTLVAFAFRLASSFAQRFWTRNRRGEQ